MTNVPSNILPFGRDTFSVRLLCFVTVYNKITMLRRHLLTSLPNLYIRLAENISLNIIYNQILIRVLDRALNIKWPSTLMNSRQKTLRLGLTV